MAHLLGSMESLSIDSVASASAAENGRNSVRSRQEGGASTRMPVNNSNNGLDAARHICQEARVVLTSLRGGPPNVARGDLAQDLMDLRQLVKQCLIHPSIVSSVVSSTAATATTHDANPASTDAEGGPVSVPPASPSPSEPAVDAGHANSDAVPSSGDDEEILDEGGAVLVQQREAVHSLQTGTDATSDLPSPNSPEPLQLDAQLTQPSVQLPHHCSPNDSSAFSAPAQAPQDAGAFARPFLSVIMDPRAAGPHTLVALRALYRLLERSSLQPSARIASALRTSTNPSPASAAIPSPSPLKSKTSTSSASDSISSSGVRFPVTLEPLTKGVLSCKFEQTDAGADEAVEMAIADLLALLVRIDRRSIHPATLMDAFNTVFITRNTFVHSPALCYHFEDVLTSMIISVFSDIQDKSQCDPAARLILGFLVNQLLHTPLLGGDDEASRDAQVAHDATRVLCLRLTRSALRYTFAHADDSVLQAAASYAALPPSPRPKAGDAGDGLQTEASMPGEDRSLLQIVQDDLCLALLMTGQAIWMNHDNPGASTGFISLEVLSEICSTMTTLWTMASLRKYLVSQFETIFTGFYQRALVLLRKRLVPQDSLAFHANVLFDAGMEVILESLVDILCLHDHKQNILNGNGGTIESLFVTYDCNLKRSDVAIDLFVELCRCTGSSVDEEGDQLEASAHGDSVGVHTDKAVVQALKSGTVEVTTGTPTVVPGTAPHPNTAPGESEATGMPTIATSPGNQIRQVPPHLKELCAEAIIGAMKCMFQDDHPSEQTRIERMERKSILPDHVEGEAPSSLSQVELLKKAQGSHRLRTIKSQKRLMRRAAALFNKKASKGIGFLVSSGLIPDPPTPRSVASFLRNGIVVGLDKKAVGAYLGEEGKKPMSGKSPPNWERDWFHKEVLEAYCSLFRFEGQSLLDGLRMFLAAFRLPGESQQIDRILQTFAETCVSACEETHQGLFSRDPKRASDAAYLLSFSIIMLNTDQHNENIREDRKMSKKDFVRNNTDYGRDIMEKGEEFPREYLEAIYDSIRLEEIRTEGEGADGSMTVERWKDVMRGSTDDDEEGSAYAEPSEHDAEDLSELVLEHVWMPIMSSVAALWNVSQSKDSLNLPLSPTGEPSTSGMLGAQGARLGMDMALEMLLGVRKVARNDLFRKIFKCVCHFSGLLNYTTDVVQRAWMFSNSVESQSAFITTFKIVREAGDEIGEEGWRMVWAMLFELRDLKMLGGGVKTRSRSILMESEPDLLKDDARRDWIMKLLKGGKDDAPVKSTGSMGVSSIFGSVGRALFGSVEDPMPMPQDEAVSQNIYKKTVHGKEDHCVWDDLAPSDDEDESENAEDSDLLAHSSGRMTVGAKFESQLIHEDLLIQQRRETPVTGLERVDDSQRTMLTPRARARKRLARVCNYSVVVSDTRFMDIDGIGNVLYALISLIQGAAIRRQTADAGDGEKPEIDVIAASALPLSPASEAFAEVLICEIALRNRDRLGLLWQKYLRRHYVDRIEYLCRLVPRHEQSMAVSMDAGLEKSITGLLRICSCAVQREGVGGDILSVFSVLNPARETQDSSMYLLVPLDGHLGEGLWRISRNIDETTKLSEHGWNGLLSLASWCAYRGSLLEPIRSGIGHQVGLSEDDPALRAYRTLHYINTVSEVKEDVPPTVVRSIRLLIIAGDRRRCPKLAAAALDVLQAVYGRIGFVNGKESRSVHDSIWTLSWRPIVETLAESAELNSYSSVRQQSLSILADSFLDKQGANIPVQHLCGALVDLCIPMAGRRIAQMKESPPAEVALDELMIELELCIGLVFKPLRHHIKMVLRAEGQALITVWKSVLSVVERALSDQSQKPPTAAATREQGAPGLPSNGIAKQMAEATNELMLEHLRNVILVLIDFDVLHPPSECPNEITAITWTTMERLESCKAYMEEWKATAAATSTGPH